MMKVTFMQTADPYVYHSMLDRTSKTFRRYCLLNGFSYESFIGIKRGTLPWQAAFNRIFMLKELLDREYDGWVFYADADSLIHDMSFDLVGYLGNKSRYGAIFAGHISEIYDVNSGGFAVNFGHPAGKGLVAEYHASFTAANQAQYATALSWQHDVYNDQYILYLILKRWYEEMDLTGTYLFEHTNHSYVNNGPFIRQHLRGSYATFGDRLAAIEADVSTVLASSIVPHPERGAGLYLLAAHPRLSTSCGIKNGWGIETTGAAGALLRGPDARLDAGQYCLRLFGSTKGIVPPFSVVRNGGTAMLATSVAARPRSADLLAELPFMLPEPAFDVAVRLDVSEQDHLCINAVQIASHSV